MNLYERYILPQLINFTCTTPPIQSVREQLVPLCYGDVLELGMGTGTNLEFYDSRKVQKLWGLEPSLGMRRKAAKNLRSSPLSVNWLDLPGEHIPLPDNSVDTVLSTFTLCTIPDWQAALRQVHRVLKPNGVFIFAEHGLAPETHIQAWQNRLNKPWRCMAGGCNLNRAIDELIQQCGFEILALEKKYLRKTPKFLGYIYQGQARKA